MKGCSVNRKAIGFVVVVGLAVLLVVGVRTANRADAAKSDCFSDSDGPAAPTICD